MFEVNGLSFSYQVGGRTVEVLRSLDFRVGAGDFVGIQGPSGSGKSTLFYILGFLLKPTTGKMFFDGEDITRLSSDELTLARNRRIGFVFQQFHLLPKATALENILLPTRYPSELYVPDGGHERKAVALARKLGIEGHLGHLPNQLSGGQQQRVAIARALMNDVELILADEPTGNLDSQAAGQILDLLSELNRQGKTIVLITHDAEVARRCAKVYHLRDGAFTQVVENFPSPSLAARFARPARAQRLPAVYSLPLYRRITQAVFPLVVENLVRNKAKSLLTMLGVVIGVAAVLAMVTLGQFTKHRILETYEALGVNKLVIRGYPNWGRKATDFVSVNFSSFDIDKDLGALQRVFPEVGLYSPALSSWGNRAVAGGLEAGEGKATVLGVTPEFLVINNRALRAGRSISPFHVETRSPVCLIGSEIAERLFSRTNPLGQSLTLTNGGSRNFPCQVIGVLAPSTSNQDWSPPNLHVLLPYTYFRTVMGWWEGQVHEVNLQVKPGSDVEATGKKIKAYFEQKYGKSIQLHVDSDSTLIAQMKKFLNIFAVLLAAIALLSLLVGGIGINNMMLVSVTERIKEFGVRKALGATSRSIRVQVLMESVTLCSVAGLAGLALGFGAYQLLIFGATKLVPNLKFAWVFEPVAAALSLLSIVAVGVASGLVPALRAERLQVIEALRNE